MPFIRGLDLSRRFYEETVRPLLDAHFPNLPHTAARIGRGSEVQGFDTERSTNHDWGPRAFARLSLPDLTDVLRSALAATTWQARETHLAEAYSTVARMHNALSLTSPVDPTTRPYHSRPYKVLHAERFADALMATVPALGDRGFVGAIDQYVDSADVLEHRDRSRAVASYTRRH
jgi:hypothetical protein